MNVFRRVVPKELKVEVLEHVEHKDETWTLRPGVAGVDVESPVAGVKRFVPPTLVARHIVVGHLPVHLLFEKLMDRFGRLAFVKRVPCRPDPRGTIPSLGRASFAPPRSW